MISRRILRLCIGPALTTVVTTGAASQAITFSDAAGRPTVLLAEAYHLRLESVWPQAAGADGACRNGGDEIVEGRLQRDVDGVYRGSFDRRTVILFCGAHGANGEACELVLEGEGKVAMTGRAVADETSPSGSALRLSWRPSPTHGAEARGACSADFKRSMEGMYLSVAHGAEVAVPAAGSGKRRERLENYPWTVEVVGE